MMRYLFLALLLGSFLTACDDGTTSAVDMSGMVDTDGGSTD